MVSLSPATGLDRSNDKSDNYCSKNTLEVLFQKPFERRNLTQNDTKRRDNEETFWRDNHFFFQYLDSNFTSRNFHMAKVFQYTRVFVRPMSRPFSAILDAILDFREVRTFRTFTHVHTMYPPLYPISFPLSRPIPYPTNAGIVGPPWVLLCSAL